MREIKFRGKRVDNGEWVYGYYSPVKLPIVGNVGHFINEGGYRAIEINFETVGQFIGLKDRDGKEAYYEDYIRFIDTDGRAFEKRLWWNNEKQCTMVGEVELNKLIDSGFFQPFIFEIIGNIHGNPDLIEASNDLRHVK
jgi:hypothetical protein